MAFDRQRGLQFVEHGSQATNDLGRVGPVADDFGHGKHQQGLEAAQLAFDSYHAIGVDVQPGRVGTAAGHNEEIAEAIDGLHPGGRVIDSGRQRPYRYVDKLPEPEGGILNEGSFTADQQEPCHVTGVELGPVGHRERRAMSQILAHPDRQLEPAGVLPAQLD